MLARGIRYNPRSFTVSTDGDEPILNAWEFLIELLSTSVLLATRRGDMKDPLRQQLFIASEDAFSLRMRKRKGEKGPYTMLDTHVTKEGNKMLIAEMKTEHIVNFCKLVLNTAIEAKHAVARQVEMNEFHRALYEVPKRDAAAVGREVRQALNRLHPYLAELFFRAPTLLVDGEAAVDEVRILLRSLTDRKGRLESKLLLTANP